MVNDICKINNENKYRDRLPKLVAAFLASFSIIEPYVLFSIGSGTGRFTIRFADFFLLIVFVLCVSRNRRMLSIISTDSLLFWYLGFSIITIISSFYPSHLSLMVSIKSIIINVIYIYIFEKIWSIECRDLFYKYVLNVGVVVSIIIFIQAICGYLGISFWNGRLPFLEVYGHWSGYISNTGAVRPNSLFQEASYAGIYLIVALAISIQGKKFKHTILFVASLLLTTSLVAICGCIICLTYMLIFSKGSGLSSKYKRRLILVVFAVLIMAFIVYCSNEHIARSVNQIIVRLSRIENSLSGDRMSSERYRLTGYSYYFDSYPFWFKLFGVGEAQFSNYLFTPDSYSNNFVTCLLNFGYFGIFFMIFMLVRLFYRMSSERRVFFLLLLLLFATDAVWFNWHFFYLITPCFVSGPLVLEVKNDKLFEH